MKNIVGCSISTLIKIFNNFFELFYSTFEQIDFSLSKYQLVFL